MDTTSKQRTIAGPAAVEGFGYWSGEDVRVEFRPAAAGSGIVFVRADLPGRPRIAATVENRVEIPRRTSLCAGTAAVEMIEHVMAALAGLGVDNCEVWTDRPETPGCDGSSQPFVWAIDAAGVVELDAPRRCRRVGEILRLGTGDCWFEVRPPECGETVLTYHLDYGPESPIARQSFQVTLDPDTFRRELAPCRTFLLKEEADWMLARGLGRRVTPKDLLIFDSDGPIQNELRFRDECARHKLMDMVGDLALAGCPLAGRFTAHRSGHRLNAEMVRALLGKTDLETVRRRCA
jgi:UDP-3-O-acyl N-acetylglucosamine deacetylase